MEGPQTSLFEAVVSIEDGQAQEGVDSGQAVLDPVGKELLDHLGAGVPDLGGFLEALFGRIFQVSAFGFRVVLQAGLALTGLLGHRMSGDQIGGLVDFDDTASDIDLDLLSDQT